MPAISNDTPTNDPTRPTLNGKELKIYMVKGTSLYCVKFADGGELPKELKHQKFTSPKEANKAITAYLDRMEKEASGKKQKPSKEKEASKKTKEEK